MLSHAPAQAKQGFYAGAQLGVISSASASENSDGVLISIPEISIPAMNLSVGYEINPYVAIEARYGFGLNEKTVIAKASNQNGSLDMSAALKVESTAGLYLKAIAPLTPEFSIYGLVGSSTMRTNATVTYQNRTAKVNSSESGPVYGVGARYLLDQEGGAAITAELLPRMTHSDASAFYAGFSLAF